MRILFLTHRLPYAPNRGDRIRAFHLLGTLTSRHDVTVISLIHDAEERAHLSRMRDHGSIEGVEVQGPSRFVHAALAYAGPTPLTHVLLHSRQMLPAIRRQLQVARPDVVVAYCSGMARYAMHPSLADVPMVLDMVDVDSEKWAALGRTTAGPRKWVFRREARCLGAFEAKAMRRAHATIVSSERERLLLQERVPDAAPVSVPNGVDPAYFSPPAPPADRLRVVFFGVFNYQPNEAGAVWFTTRVWPIVRHHEPRAELALVGMNPTDAVRALCSDPSVTVTGAVPDVRPYLWDSAVSVAPLHLARGVQNKVLEAVAARLPCVVTPAVFEGLPDAVRPACLVQSEPRPFAEAVVALMRKGGADRRALAATADIEAITWSKQLRPFLEIVAAAAQEPPHARHLRRRAPTKLAAVM